MAKDVFERIVTSAPLTASAARVTARGEHWKPEKPVPPGLQHWDAPPPMVPFEQDSMGVSINLTGVKFGRFTVVGVLAAMTAKGKQRWVCKCTCGDYEVRSASAIRMATTYLNEKNEVGYRCWNCQQWANVQKNMDRKGSRPLSDFINAKDRVVNLEPQSPNTILATEIARLTGSEDGAYGQAVNMISELNRSGYRIVRDRQN